ncbi:MAG: hypothetical protein K2X93_00895 [Candidatus Obscuribacterales bacterium]|nr:hypothetical protein [Candidatus Obscuribacterales bacterium]
MSYTKITSSNSGRYYTLKSLQPLNLDELQYLHHGGLTPQKKKCNGFFNKCIESFRVNFPKVKQFLDELLYEPIQSDVYSHAE